MYNATKPDPSELPSAGRLLRSTAIAIAAATLILVTVVLPAEYGIDPTRVGRMLGLAEMGEIKVQLAEEAEADRQLELQGAGDETSALERILRLIETPAYAHEDEEHVHEPAMEPAGVEALAAPESEWTETASLTLAPGEGKEIKLIMEEGAVAEFRWVVEGGVVNYDLHGDGAGGASTSYQRDRAVPGHEGALTAAFTGNHGWFWRNRDDQDVTVTLYVRGDYSELKHMY